MQIVAVNRNAYHTLDQLRELCHIKKSEEHAFYCVEGVSPEDSGLIFYFFLTEIDRPFPESISDPTHLIKKIGFIFADDYIKPVKKNTRTVWCPKCVYSFNIEYKIGSYILCPQCGTSSKIRSNIPYIWAGRPVKLKRYLDITEKKFDCRTISLAEPNTERHMLTAPVA